MRDHGFVFEVDPHSPNANAGPVPLRAMGRFAHEAVAVDPERGHVYLTEDALFPNGLLYRFTPTVTGSLRAGGRLEAMRATGARDLSRFDRLGTALPVEWVPVPDPLAASTSTRMQFTYVDYGTGATVRGPAGEATRSSKLEGAWWARGRAFVVASSARGDSDWSEGTHDGQVWSYDPARSELVLEAYFPHGGEAGGPDNICASPWGGLFVAEDGEDDQHLVAVASDGTPHLSPATR